MLFKRSRSVILAFLLFSSSSVVFALVPNPKWGPAPEDLLLENDLAQQGMEQKIIETIPSREVIGNEDLINWQNKDPLDDGFEGTSLLKLHHTGEVKGQGPVIVAVIDSGVDISHEMIKDHLWTDPKTGAHGWNFLGNRKGENIDCATLEVTREYVNCKKGINHGGTPNYCNDVKTAFNNKRIDAENYAPEQNLPVIKKYLKKAKKLAANIGLQDFTYNDIEKLTPKNKKGEKAKKEALKFMDELMTVKLVNHDKIFINGGRLFSKDDYVLTTGEQRKAHQLINRLTGLVRTFDYRKVTLEYALNDKFDPRAKIIGDNPDDFNDDANGNYGNNDVTGPIESAIHGTHVAGIILQAADKQNKLTDNHIDVQIMSVRAVPCGGTDEYDKDVANAILFATDHGAKIINGSFGKDFSPHKNKVKAAVRYAAEHGVIIVHAAGNDHKDLDNDQTPNYPNRYYEDGKAVVPTWIEVGASDKKLGKFLVAKFSNYGKNSVDLFAPGVDIYSSVPGGYDFLQGTSMASPVVAGTIAVMYAAWKDKIDRNSSWAGPTSAAQALINILEGAERIDRYKNLSVLRPGSTKEVQFSDLSITGGIIDGYNGFIKLALTKNL